jgi:hypothetical protein
MLHDTLQRVVPQIADQRTQQLVIDDLERQMADHEVDFARVLTELQKLFVFIDQEEIAGFLRSNRSLATILADSAPSLTEAFPGTPLALDMMIEEGAPRTIYALALWHGDRASARKALNDFDERWWLANMRKAAGRVVFDYELMP